MAMLDFSNYFWLYAITFLADFSHPCVLDSGNPCRNDGDMTCVYIYAYGSSTLAALSVV